MKLPTLSWIPVTLIGILLIGCAPSAGEFGYDNPNIRELQRKQSTAVIPSESKRRALARDCGRKTFFVTAGNSPRKSSSGRAAAISSDGYFLTAYHVVQNGPFFLSDAKLTTEQNQKLKSAGFLLEEKGPERGLPGRLVWYDEGADLAVIKFNVKTPRYFSQLQFPAPVNEVIYSSDDQGVISLPKGKPSADAGYLAVGNGPYFSAGKVLFSQLFTHGPGVHTIGSSLVARGGMSGGPIVTLNGKLCGILTQVGFYFYEVNDQLEVSLRSTSRMLPPKVLRDLVSKDRARNRI